MTRFVPLAMASLVLGCGDDAKKSSDTAVTLPDAGGDATGDAASDATGADADPTDAATDATAPDATPTDASDDSNDASDVADTPSDVVSGPDFACLGADPSYPSAAAGELAYDAKAVGFVSGNAIAGVHARFCGRLDPDCAAPVHEATSDAGGIFRVEVPSGFDGFIVADGGGIVPTLQVVDPPILAAPATSPAPMPLVAPTEVQAFAGAFSVTLDASKGQLLASALDCDLAGAAGLTLKVTTDDGFPETGLVIGYLANGLPAPSATATSAGGAAGVFNLTPGWHIVRAVTADGTVYGRARALIRAGTLTRVAITPMQTTPDLACDGAPLRAAPVLGPVSQPFVMRGFGSPVAAANAHYKVCAPGDEACANPLAEGDVDGEGRFSADLTLEAGGFLGFVEITGTSVFPTRVVFNPPLTASSATPEPRLIEVVSQPLLEGVAAGAGAELDPTLAHVLVRVRDCRFVPAHGMVVSVDRTTPKTKPIYFANGLPSQAASATDDGGLAGLFDVAVDEPLVLTAASDGSPIGSVTFRTRAGYLYQVEVVPSPVVTTSTGAVGLIQVYEDFAFGSLFATGTIVRFSNAPECVLRLRDQLAPNVDAGVLTMGGPVVGSEGATPEPVSMLPDCGNAYVYIGPTVPPSDALAVELSLTGSAEAPAMPVQSLLPGAAAMVEVTAPLPDDTGSFSVSSTAPLELAWVVPDGIGAAQRIVFGFTVGAEMHQPYGDLYCGFPVSAGAATVPANVLEEMALRIGSGASGAMHVLAGGQREATPGGASYVIEVTRGLDSTNLPYDGLAELTSARVPPPAPPVDELVIPDPEGPIPPVEVHCALRVGGTGFDALTSVDVASDGSFVVAGSFRDSAGFGDGTPLGQLTSNGAADIVLARYDAQCGLQWVRQAGGPGFDLGLNVALAADGGIYLIGTYSDGAVFGVAGETNRVTLTSAGASDFFLARYGADGALQWVRTGGGAEDERAFGVADTTGGVFVSGRFRATATFGTSELVAGSSIGGAAFIAKYDDVGGLKWIRQVGDGDSGDVDVFGVATANDDLVLTGNFIGTTVFGGGEASEELLESPCTVDGFVARYTGASGTLGWVQLFGGEGFEYPVDVTVDSAGSVLVTGSYGPGTVTFPTGVGGISLSSDTSDGFAARFSSFDGRAGGAVGITGLGQGEQGYAVRGTGDNGFVVVGNFADYAVFGAEDLYRTTLVSAGGRDAFVARYSAGGDIAWARALSSTGSFDTAQRVAVAPNGDIIVVGNFDAELTIAPSRSLGPAAGGADGFVVVYR